MKFTKIFLFILLAFFFIGINYTFAASGSGSKTVTVTVPPVNGGWSAWNGTWSQCTATCGTGTQTQSRTCTNPSPVGTGSNCSSLDGGSLTKSQDCNTQVCPVDCAGSFSDTTTCDVTCGSGHLIEKFKITTAKVGTGASCSFADGATQSGTTACSKPDCPPNTCSDPLSKTITGIQCDPKNGVSATSGSVIRSQNKSSYPGCSFPSTVDNTNSTYVSDNCGYNGTWSYSAACPTACGLTSSTQTQTCTGGNGSCSGTAATRTCSATTACTTTTGSWSYPTACPTACESTSSTQTQTCTGGNGSCSGTAGTRTCSATGTCATCYDGIKNQNETSIDTGGTCATGNLTISPTSCTIAENASTCTVTGATWTTSKTTSPVALVDANVNSTLSNLANNSTALKVWVAFPQTRFELRDNTRTLTSRGIFAMCASGTGWNMTSKTCKSNSPTCSSPPTQNVTVQCDLNSNGDSAISGSVTRRQTKSAYPQCTYGSPVTTSNSTYVSDNCVYPAIVGEKLDGVWSMWSPTRSDICGASGTQNRTCVYPNPSNKGAYCPSDADGLALTKDYTNTNCPIVTTPVVNSGSKIVSDGGKIPYNGKITMSWEQQNIASCTCTYKDSTGKTVDCPNFIGTPYSPPALKKSTLFTLSCLGNIWGSVTVTKEVLVNDINTNYIEN